jgi:hypothetical protein
MMRREQFQFEESPCMVYSTPLTNEVSKSSWAPKPELQDVLPSRDLYNGLRFRQRPEEVEQGALLDAVGGHSDS